MKKIKIVPPERGCDQHGCGNYGASRDGGKRKHEGVDIACMKGSIILSPVKGVVTKIGYPYSSSDPVKGHLRYVEIKEEGVDLYHRFFYVRPLLELGEEVSEGDEIAITQGLTSIYLGITDHFHYEIKDAKGGFINPNASRI